MEEVTLKERKMKALQWNDNLSEMKHFCGSKCTITYETCEIDDFWLLKVSDYIRGEYVTVPTGDYVVEFAEGCFVAMKKSEMNFWFDESKHKSGAESIVTEIKTVTEELSSIKETIAYKNEGKVPDGFYMTVIPENTMVKIISCRHDPNGAAIYINKIGTVKHFWKKNPCGEYVVSLDDGYSSCFDRDELLVI